MRVGFVFPGGDPGACAEFAVEAERAGWDGLFVWEPVRDWEAWASLAAAAVRTERIRLGTMVTPLSRMPRGRSPARPSPSTTSRAGVSRSRSASARPTPAGPRSPRRPTATSAPSCWTRGSRS